MKKVFQAILEILKQITFEDTAHSQPASPGTPSQSRERVNITILGYFSETKFLTIKLSDRELLRSVICRGICLRLQSGDLSSRLNRTKTLAIIAALSNNENKLIECKGGKLR
jgi:hypothetical protein